MVKINIVKDVNNKQVQIIKAARKVLLQEGSGGFSMRRVAQEAEMSLGNLQYYYRSRTDLLDGLLTNYIEEYRRGFDELMQVAGTGKERLRTLIGEILKETETDEELAFFRALFSFTEIEVVEEVLSRYYRDLYDLLAGGLAQLGGQGPESDGVQQGASLLLPYFDGYGLTAPHLGVGRERMTEMLSEIVWGMLEAGA